MKLSPQEMEHKRGCEHCHTRLAVKKIWLRDMWKFYCGTCWK